MKNINEFHDVDEFYVFEFVHSNGIWKSLNFIPLCIPYPHSQISPTEYNILAFIMNESRNFFKGPELG